MAQLPTSPMGPAARRPQDDKPIKGPGMSRKRVIATALLVAALLVVTVVVAKRQKAVSPLEPTEATQSVLVPAERELTLPAAAKQPALDLNPPTLSASASGVINSSEPLTLTKLQTTTSEALLAVEPVAVAASASQVASVAIQPAMTLEQLAERVRALETEQSKHLDQIALLNNELNNQKVQFITNARVAAGGSSDAGSALRPAVKLQGFKSASQPPGNAGAVLAVDLWGGKPSVAMARTGNNGQEIRFYGEGEGKGRVTLKRADTGTQKATFSSPAGEFTLAPKEQ